MTEKFPWTTGKFTLGPPDPALQLLQVDAIGEGNFHTVELGLRATPLLQLVGGLLVRGDEVHGHVQVADVIEAPAVGPVLLASQLSQQLPASGSFWATRQEHEHARISAA